MGISVIRAVKVVLVRSPQLEMAVLRFYEVVLHCLGVSVAALCVQCMRDLDTLVIPMHARVI